MNRNEFKLECMTFDSRLGLHSGVKKELIDFGVYNKTINIKHPEGLEIIIDKDIAVAILKNITKAESNHRKLIKTQPPTDMVRIIR